MEPRPRYGAWHWRENYEQEGFRNGRRIRGRRGHHRRAGNGRRDRDHPGRTGPAGRRAGPAGRRPGRGPADHAAPAG
ncbi:hypothetical protein GA599_08980, partial [Bifidobacterium adolescentis]